MSMVRFLAKGLNMRVRMALFFLLIAVASVALVGLADYYAIQAADGSDYGFIVRAGIFSAFGVFAIVTAAWLQFDIHVARPIDNLARYAQTAAHAEGLAESALPDGRYLGNLAPAIFELSQALDKLRSQQQAAVLEATGRAERQKARLESVLHDLRDGILICNHEHEILLYNPSAVEILSPVGTIGLRRSVFEVLAPAPVRHNLARLEKRFRDGRRLSHAHGLSLPFAAQCVDGKTTIEATMALTLVPGSPEPQGYILTFSDETEMLAASAESERRAIALAERIREHAGALHLMSEMLERGDGLSVRARELTRSVMDEIIWLTETSGDLDRLATEALSRTWPMGPVLAITLFELVGERIRLDEPLESHAEPDTAMLCDSAAIAALLARLCEWVHSRGGHGISLRASLEDDEGYLDIVWSGQPVSIREIEDWLASALDHDLGPVTASDVLARHATDIWSDLVTGNSNQARLRIPLQMRDLSGMPVVAARVMERVPVYDFDIFDENLPDDVADTPLRQLTAVVFDTETTGLEPSHGDKMVSIAGVRIVNGRVLENEIFNEFVNPGRPIPARSTAVHGITNAMVTGAEPPETVVQRFGIFASDAVLVAHNAPFDMRFLALSGKSVGLQFRNPVLDTVLLAAHIHGTDESLTLDRLAEIYQVKLPAEVRHTALGDALATARVFVALLGPLEAAGIRTLGQAIKASESQAALRRKQARYE